VTDPVQDSANGQFPGGPEPGNAVLAADLPIGLLVRRFRIARPLTHGELADARAFGLHIAHQLRAAGRVPDGQLYVNLQGAGPVPADPREVLGRLLSQLGA
jgi:hypothetical protein